MMTQLRRGWAQKIMYAFLIMFIVLFAADTVLRYFLIDVSTHNAAAIVGDHAISINRYQRQLSSVQRYIETIRQQVGSRADALLRSLNLLTNPGALVMRELVNEAIWLDTADKLHMRVSPRYAREQRQNPLFLFEHLGDIISPYAIDSLGGLSDDVLRYQLRQAGVSQDEFEQRIVDTVKKLTAETATLGAFYIPNDVNRLSYLHSYAQKMFSYLVFSRADYEKKIQHEQVSTDTLRGFFERENKAHKRYWQPQERRGVFWRFTPENYGLTISDESVKSYYENHKEQFVKEPAAVELRSIFLKATAGNREDVKEKAHALHEELTQEPTLFAKKAEAVSDDAKTAKKGGYLGFVPRNSTQYSTDFIAMAFGLSSDGAISSVREVANGFEIVGRVSRREPTYKALDDVKQTILPLIRSEKFSQRFEADANRLMHAQEVQGAEGTAQLQSFIQRKGGKKQTSALVNKQDNSFIANKLFTIDTISEYAVGINDNVGYIIQLQEIKPTYALDFNAIQERVRTDWTRNKAQEQMTADMHKAENLLAGDDQLASVAQQVGVTVQKTEWLDPQKKYPALEKKGLPISRMHYLIHEKSTITHETTDKAFVITLADIEKIDPATYAKQTETLGKEAYQKYSSRFLAGFIDQRRRIVDPRILIGNE